MSELIIISGASSNHFACLINLLYSASVFETKTAVVIYDLGLESWQSLHFKVHGFDVRRFPFELYPAYLDIRLAAGQYAWKPVIIAEILGKTDGMVLWLDAGNLIHGRLDRIRHVLKTQGVYTPTSSGNIAQWTHPGTLARLGASPRLLSKPNRNAAIVGLNAGSRAAVDLTERWKDCALDLSCIAPPGSNRSNHRQDQAILSVLAYQFQQKYGYKLVDHRMDISTHNDRLRNSLVQEKIKAWSSLTLGAENLLLIPQVPQKGPDSTRN